MSSNGESKEPEKATKNPSTRPPAPGKKNNFLMLVDIPSFRWFWISQCINLIGTRFFRLALMLAASKLSGSNIRTVAWIAAGSSVPTLLTAFFGGPIVDRVNHRRFVIMCNLIGGALMILCAPAFQLKSLPLMALLIVLCGLVMGFNGPATGALVPQIVPRNRLFGANALNSLSNTLALTLGPVLAGTVIGRWGTEAAFIINGISYVVAAFFLWLISASELSSRKKKQRASYWNEMGAGFKHVWNTSLMRNFVGMLLIPLFFIIGVSLAIFVPFLQLTFNIGASEIGFTGAAIGAGVVVGGVITGLGWFNKVPETIIGIVATVLFALACFTRGLSPNYYYFMVGNLFGGIALILGSASFRTVVQKNTPIKMLGRVGGLLGTMSNSSNLAGMALAPFLVKLAGLRGIYITMGVAMIISILTYLATTGRNAPGDESPADTPDSAADQEPR